MKLTVKPIKTFKCMVLKYGLENPRNMAWALDALTLRQANLLAFARLNEWSATRQQCAEFLGVSVETVSSMIWHMENSLSAKHHVLAEEGTERGDDLRKARDRQYRSFEGTVTMMVRGA